MRSNGHCAGSTPIGSISISSTSPIASTPIAETLSALDELIRSGKVRYIGSSNFQSWQLADAEWTARTEGSQRFIATQTRHNLLNPAGEALEACARYRIGLIPTQPLAEGMLTGKFRRDRPRPDSHRTRLQPTATDLDRIEALVDFAESRNTDLLSVAIGGLLANENVSSVIAGATNPAQVKSNVAASGWRPDHADLDLLWSR